MQILDDNELESEASTIMEELYNQFEEEDVTKNAQDRPSKQLDTQNTHPNKNKNQEEKAKEKVEKSYQTLESTMDELKISRTNEHNLRQESFELDFDNVRNWPLFKDFRSTQKKIYTELQQKYSNSKK